MALWLAVSVKRGERNIVLPVTVEYEPDETVMDLNMLMRACNFNKNKITRSSMLIYFI